MSKFYLGDAVYVDFEDEMIVLTTEDGLSISNRIYMERKVYDNLVLYVDRLKAVDKNVT